MFSDELIVKLSVTGKLDGIKSWSLQAIETCPGSIGVDGELVDACKGCYATIGNYCYPSPKKTRADNKIAWQNNNFVALMVKALSIEKYFRLFDSGDFYSVDLAQKWYDIMLQSPTVKFWVPTRMHKFAKFNGVLTKMANLPNVSVRFSSDSVTGEYVSGLHGSTIIRDSEDVPEGIKVCNAYANAGKCNGCRNCWDKDIPVIGYVAHGLKMKKVYRLKSV